MDLVLQNPEVSICKAIGEVDIFNGSGTYVPTGFGKQVYVELCKFKKNPEYKTVCLPYFNEKNLRHIIADPRLGFKKAAKI